MQSIFKVCSASEWTDKQEPGVSEHGPSKIYKENLHY